MARPNNGFAAIRTTAIKIAVERERYATDRRARRSRENRIELVGDSVCGSHGLCNYPRGNFCNAVKPSRGACNDFERGKELERSEWKDPVVLSFQRRGFPSLGSGILFRESLQSRETTDAERRKGVSGSDEANETRFTSTGREERSIKEKERETIEEETRKVEERREERRPRMSYMSPPGHSFSFERQKYVRKSWRWGDDARRQTRGTVAKSRRRTSNKIHLR